MLTNGDLRDEIVRLEGQIDELADKIESCRKFMPTGKIAVAGGVVVLIAGPIRSVSYDDCGQGAAPREKNFQRSLTRRCFGQ
jgi:hypothetical protein